MPDKVGVIIPCHNYGKYVIDALDSAIDQDYKGDICVVIVDDGSEDDTVQTILKEFPDDSFVDADYYSYNYNISSWNSSEWNNRSVLIRRLPSATGPSNARNVGIELAFKENCDIIAFLDADDMMVDNKISTMVKELNNLGDGAVYADYYHLYPDGNFRIELKEPFDLERFIYENIGANNTSLVTKKALETVKENDAYFDVTMRTCEDYDLFMRIAEKFPIKHIAEPLTFLRVHSNNSTNTVTNETWKRDRQKVNEKILQRQNSCK